MKGILVLRMALKGVKTCPRTLISNDYLFIVNFYKETARSKFRFT